MVYGDVEMEETVMMGNGLPWRLKGDEPGKLRLIQRYKFSLLSKLDTFLLSTMACSQDEFSARMGFGLEVWAATYCFSFIGLLLAASLSY